MAVTEAIAQLRTSRAGKYRMCAVALLVCFVLAVPAGAQKTERAKALGKQMMCMCGCNQILTECNHVGCTVSAAMLKELDDRVARNESDSLTLQAFQQEYGLAVMAQPASHGFGLTAWILPVVVLLLGAWLVSVVLQRWRRRVVAPVPHVRADLLDRARRESGDDE
jgi:cytochrome c-type biogenesis protein CcmH/NrfF